LERATGSSSYNLARRSVSAFPTTLTEESAMAAAAMIGEEQEPEHRIKRAGGNRDAGRVVDEREEQVLGNVAHRGGGQPARPHDAAGLHLSNVTPALSIATSVPVPMAMPTSAAASAGGVMDAARHRHDAVLAAQLSTEEHSR
jgi:hypothetical protein